MELDPHSGPRKACRLTWQPRLCPHRTLAWMCLLFELWWEMTVRYLSCFWPSTAAV